MTFGLISKPSNEETLVPPQLKMVSPDDFHRAIYVSAASSEIERAEAVMAKLEKGGMLVTSTWAANIRKVGASNPMDVSREQRALWSAVDLHEVSQSGIMLLLIPPKKTSTAGAWVEMGYFAALQAIIELMRASGQPVPDEANRWLLCSGVEHSIFTALADHYPTDDEAVRAVLSAALDVASDG